MTEPGAAALLAFADTQRPVGVEARTLSAAEALELESWPDVAVDVNHEQLAGVEDWRNALVASCSADVLTE